MSKLLSVMVLGLSLSAGAALAASHAGAPMAGASEAKKAPTAQQERMKTCNADAKGKKGDERAAFMKSCLSGEEKKMTQQEKMKACNADPKAKATKGDERKKFMSECLKG